ncbi:MAG TPA: ABC-2 family transporter protein [Candidatus Atribacteria bacterium]|nr:ABC-2 family transporter protein [Candidatus Atribacteria bacterium]HPT78428.1 ABC-2 family transporter protein [Candidatus Atribacteria bacterium]
MAKLRKYLVVTRISLQNVIAYRSSALGGLLFYSLFIFVFFNLWRAIYKGGEVTGYSLTQMIWYLCITELVVFGCRSGVYNQMNDDVKSGSIAYQLNRPYHYVMFQFFNALGNMVFNLVIYGILAIILGLIMAGPIPGFSFASLPFALISVFLGIIINFFFMITLGLTAFRLEENFAFYLIYQKLVFMLGMFIPVEFLPKWLQSIALYLPFSYVAWAPARLVVAFSWDLFWQVIPVQLVWALVSILMSLGMYSYGVKGIQAHGG